jgi:hypothetical protein
MPAQRCAHDTQVCVRVCKTVVLAAVLCCCGAVATAAGTAPHWRALLRAALRARARFQKVCYVSGARVTPRICKTCCSRGAGGRRQMLPNRHETAAKLSRAFNCLKPAAKLPRCMPKRHEAAPDKSTVTNPRVKEHRTSHHGPQNTPPSLPNAGTLNSPRP